MRVLHESADRAARFRVDNESSERAGAADPDGVAFSIAEQCRHQRRGGERLRQQPSRDRIRVMAENPLQRQLPEIPDHKLKGRFLEYRVQHEVRQVALHF